MGAAFIALSLLAAAPGGGPPPLPSALVPAAGELRAALNGAVGRVERLGACAYEQPRHEERYQALFHRYVTLLADVRAIYGRRVDPTDFPNYAEPLRCEDAQFARDADKAAETLASGEAVLQRLRAGMTGLWIGPIPMCGGAIARLATGLDEMDDSPYAIITLRADISRAFAAETTARVGMPLAIHLDGRRIMNPNVNEPIAGGQVQLQPAEPADVERIRAGIDRPC